MRASMRLGVLFVLLMGCGTPSPSDAGPDAGILPEAGCGVGSGTLEVGRGGSRAVRLQEGDALPIVVGAQGGIHVVVAAWVSDIDLELQMTYRLRSEGGEVVGTETTVALRPSLFRPDGARFLRHPDLVVLDNDVPRAEDFDGLEVTLEAEARASDGSVACDARPVTLSAD